MTKTLSVVIASGEGGEFLPRCLDSLRQQAAGEGAKILVVDRCGADRVSRVEKEFPFVTVVRAPSDHRPSVPELRAIGVEHAQTDLVAVIEEHCVADPNWIATILAAFSEKDAAIGGPVLDDDFRRVRDWVVYFSEYHNYLPPWPEGEPRYMLNEANIAYRRELLLKHRQKLRQGYWGVVLHPHLAREGAFRSVPSMKVRHTGPFDYGYYLTQRYLLSRAWGGTQRDRMGVFPRLVHIGAAPLMPAFLLARITRRVFQSGVRTGKYVSAFPLLIPVLLAYSWGELKGYAFGAGDALERVE